MLVRNIWTDHMHAWIQDFHNTTCKHQQFLEPFLDLCVSSLREGHANLLCIVPILTDVAEATEI